MAREYVNHRELVQFAQDKVNLPKIKADEYRAQARRVREKLEKYLLKLPNFSLRKIMLSGSLAKGTSLKSLNDIDMACYISGAGLPRSIESLLDYLTKCLRSAFPNLSPDQVQPKTYSVTISFKGTGLDIDVVPVLYDNDPNWYGYLVSQDDGSFLETCIPRHLEFIRTRKLKQDKHFAQTIRLVKYWVKHMKSERRDFRFKSFMVELIMAKLLDQGKDFSDYPEALQHFFTYVAISNLNEIIYFTDYYSKSKILNYGERIKIIDPVNEKNNTAKLYKSHEAENIVNASLEAGDAIDAAMKATTKQDTIYYWQKIFGPTFSI